MKILLYVAIALVVFCGMVVLTLHFKGALNKEALTSLKSSFLTQDEGAEQDVGSERQVEGPVLPLATALAEKEEQLAQWETEIAQERKRLEQEEARFEEIRKEVETLLKQMQQQVDSLDAEEEERLTDLAKTYAGMRPEGAAQILQKLPVDDAVRILMRTPTRNRARIVEKMENASDISEAIIAAVGQ